MAVLKYSLLRLGVFAAVFFACLYLDLGQFTVPFAMICGVVISWAVGYLFFNSWRVAAGEQLARRLGSKRKLAESEADDNAAEDELAEEFHRAQETAAEDRLGPENPQQRPSR
ncbi:DUF4229 domain-containing protein [Nesterenkonia flava]|uniref:DUF4229 domain-containing protein n=1 Tax=Nesterenkonia flava TaxID=469799 RepID=A0ABU1FR74_9MICC|nr:DUF4229 domain-containing protein [Nesterenkonia flava]MDR5711155.1 DUF4229 domain-containing protein [Nesterenkonia flava]